MIEPRFVDANGLRFGYLEQGRGPLVLLAHGFPDTAYTWDQALPAFAQAGYRAVAPFLRGYAPSELAPDGAYDTDTLARDLLALIEALGEARAVVIGHDWGASAGYGAAAIGGDRVRLLIPMAIPHPRSIRPTPRLLWAGRHMLRLRMPDAAAKVRRDGFAYVDELWRRWSPQWADLPATETAAVKRAFRQPGSVEAACAYYRTIGLRGPRSHEPAIRVPTVAFAGEADVVATRAFEKARHCFAGPYQVVAVPGGHFMHREHPDEVIPELVRVVRDFDRAR